MTKQKFDSVCGTKVTCVWFTDCNKDRLVIGNIEINNAIVLSLFLRYDPEEPTEIEKIWWPATNYGKRKVSPFEITNRFVEKYLLDAVKQRYVNWRKKAIEAVAEIETAF